MTSESSRWIWIGVFASACIVVIVLPWQHLPQFTCPIKALIGIGCPTCGGTTAIIAFRRLDFFSAFRANPMVTSGMLAAGLWGILMIIVPAIPTPDRMRHALRYVIISAVAVTTVYLTACSPR